MNIWKKIWYNGIKMMNSVMIDYFNRVSLFYHLPIHIFFFFFFNDDETRIHYIRCTPRFCILTCKPIHIFLITHNECLVYWSSIWYSFINLIWYSSISLIWKSNHGIIIFSIWYSSINLMIKEVEYMSRILIL